MKLSRLHILLLFSFALLPVVTLVMAETISDESGSIITINGGIDCDAQGLFGQPYGSWINYSNSPPIILSTTTGFGECFRPDAVLSNFCCPVGYSCEPEGTFDPDTGFEQHSCKTSTLQFCHDFTEESSCINATSWIPNANIETYVGLGEDYCDSTESIYNASSDTTSCFAVTCGCEWSALNTTCLVESNRFEISCSAPDIENPIEQDVCNYNTVDLIDLCTEGQGIFYSWVIVEATGEYALGGSRADECKEGSETIPCGNVVKLPFFTVWQFFISLILIAGIYGMTLVRKRKLLLHKHF
jgi:hypothetical protein